MGTFEAFKGGPNQPRENRIHITLSPRHVVYMNRNARQMLGSATHVVLHYNREDAIIGVTSAHPRLQEAFPLVEKGGYWKINASPFCRNYNIKVHSTQAFVRPDVDAKGMLRLDLKTTVRSSRAGREDR